MNEQDKKAFEKWFLEYPSWVVTMSRQESCSKAWQAACEYKQKEIYGLNQSLETSVYHDKKQLKIIQKLEAKNAKLRECVEFYANETHWDLDQFTDQSDIDEINVMNRRIEYSAGKRARQVLKELDNNQLDETK